MTTRYARFSPRGFANEATIYVVRADQIAEVQAEMDRIADETTGSAEWVAEPQNATDIAIEWDYRGY